MINVILPKPTLVKEKQPVTMPLIKHQSLSFGASEFCLQRSVPIHPTMTQLLIRLSRDAQALAS